MKNFTINYVIPATISLTSNSMNAICMAAVVPVEVRATVR